MNEHHHHFYTEYKIKRIEFHQQLKKIEDKNSKKVIDTKIAHFST